MPVISVELGAGQANEAQKKDLIVRLTANAAEITGIPTANFTTFIKEFPLENIGVGGRTVKDIKAGR
jgi:4-oxalocrotonate tautomerase